MPWPPLRLEGQGYIKCDGEQILFLDSSVYIHIKAFMHPNSVKLLPRSQLFPCGPGCTFFFLPQREVAWQRMGAIPYRAQVKGKGEKRAQVKCNIKNDLS